jgi:hypothetical protein
MHLKWDFEEGFGADVRSEPIRRVTSKMSRSVVALASFVVDKTEYSGEHRKGDFTSFSSLYFIYLVTC